MSSRRRRGGFTLLEVVLAMTALALVAAICYGAFHLGIRAVERGEIAVVTAQRLRAAADTIIRQVKSTVAYPVRTEDEEIFPYFFGSPTQMRFVTAGALIGGGGLARVTFAVEGDPPRLVLEEAPFFSPDALGAESFDAVGARAATLLDGFTGARFAYLLYDGADYEWRTSWDAREEDMLPVAVRVTVEGLAGVESGIWGQEIPLMMALSGGEPPEIDEEGLADLPLPGRSTPDADDRDSDPEPEPDLEPE